MNEWARERRALRAFKWARYFAALDLGLFAGAIVGARGRAVKGLQAATRTHIEVPRPQGAANAANAANATDADTAPSPGSVPSADTAESTSSGSAGLCVGMCVHVYGRNKGNVVDCANRLVHLCCGSAGAARGAGAGAGAGAEGHNAIAAARAHRAAPRVRRCSTCKV